MTQIGPKFWGEIPTFSSKVGEMGEKYTFPSLRIAKVTEIHPKLANLGYSEAYGQRLRPWLKLGPNFGVESQHFGQKWEKWVKNAHFCPSSPPKPQNSPKISQFRPIFSQNWGIWAPILGQIPTCWEEWVKNAHFHPSGSQKSPKFTQNWPNLGVLRPTLNG